MFKKKQAQKPVSERLNEKLKIKEIAQAKEALIAYLAENNLDPKKVTPDTKLLENVYPYLLEEGGTWVGLKLEHLSTGHKIIFELYGIFRSAFSSADPLSKKIDNYLEEQDQELSEEDGGEVPESPKGQVL